MRFFERRERFVNLLPKTLIFCLILLYNSVNVTLLSSKVFSEICSQLLFNGLYVNLRERSWTISLNPSLFQLVSNLLDSYITQNVTIFDHDLTITTVFLRECKITKKYVKQKKLEKKLSTIVLIRELRQNQPTSARQVQIYE